ncbi:BTB POZ domain-containing protein [Musa troglodytarum]|uniref:BTB POZ domain-containing protein n=1 Tax=Musa troglodytarum TaxID=320322 RepID=A0A9E7JSP6_9LILI|nr:BTB POZ domain-containing protein [Musa troglodytarum]
MATMKLGSKAEAFQLEGQTWQASFHLTLDVVIEVGEMSFHLHKSFLLQTEMYRWFCHSMCSIRGLIHFVIALQFPLLNRSGLLGRMISEFRSEDGKACVLHLHDIPGGAKAFELAAKFCYDIRIELNATNVVPVRCAAEHLLMTEDYVGGNLITRTDNFLGEVLGSWKDTIKALEACESVLPHAEDLHIVSRCINSLASKASLADWWYIDASFLGLPLFKRLILAMEAKGMKPENVAEALIYSAKRSLPGLSGGSTAARMTPGISISAASESEQRVFLEEIVDLLPMNKGVISTRFLLRLLRTAMILRASPSCRENLERRTGAQVEEAALEDLLIPSLGPSVETLYDVDCVQRILVHFMQLNQSAVTSSAIVDEGQSITSSSSPTPMAMVARLVDVYLAEVAADVNLKLHKFLSLASAVSDYARPLDDGIYRAIDVYLKSHPWLTESEREQICQLINCQKLSLEACTHAAQNERLPLRLVVQVLFFEQLHLRSSIAGWLFVSDRENDDHHVDVDDMRSQVLELEKECLSMKQEIGKLGKPRSSWNIFSRKCGFGVKSQSVAGGK